MAALALAKECEKNGIKATLVKLKTPDGEALVRTGGYTQEIATANSEGHFGVLAGDKVYGDVFYKRCSVPVGQWAKGYEYAPKTSSASIANPILEADGKTKSRRGRLRRGSG